MGATVEPRLHSVEDVTRVAWRRALDPYTWESLVRQAAAASSIPPEKLESQVSTAILGLLAGAPDPSSTSPTLTAYLHHCIGLKSSSSSSSRALVRPGYLARRALESAAGLDIILATVNEAFDSPSFPEDASVYAATTVDETLEAVQRVSELVVAGHLGPATVRYFETLLGRLPVRISVSGIDEDRVERVVGGIRGALEALGAGAGEEGLYRLLGGVRGMLDRTPLELPVAPVDLNAATSFPDPDVAFLLSDLLNRSSSSLGISNTQASVARLTALLKFRIADSAARGSSVEEALSSAFLEILLAATAQIRMGEGRSVAHECFAYARLPEVLRALFAKGGLVDESVLDGLQGSLEGAFRRFKAIIAPMGADAMDTDDRPNLAFLNLLLTGFCRQELISIDVGASLGDGLHPEDLQPQPAQDFYSRIVTEGEPDGLKELLGIMSTDFSSQGAIALGLQQAIETWTRDQDLPMLALACTVLVEVPEILEIVFLHLEPHIVLKPIRDLLETFDASEEMFGDGHPIARYGVVVLFLEVVLSRFDLHRNLAHHLGSHKGFFCRWIPSISAVYSLPDLDQDSKSVVDGWIAALFGEGISDDLMQSTKPHVILRVAPTICKQFLAACQAGVIDIDSLREASAYFLQELLSFTLPGIIRWLVGEIRLAPPGMSLTALYEVLQVFVFADTLPPMVLELVASDLLPLASVTTTPAPLDAARLLEILKPYRSPVSDEGAKSQTTWLHQLNANLSASIDTPTLRPNLSLSLTNSLLNSSTSEVVSSVIERLLFLTHRLPLVFAPQETLRAARIRRAGAAILGVVGTDESRSWPLLTTFVGDIVPRTIMSLATQRTRLSSNAMARLETLGDVLSAALLAALLLAAEQGWPREDNQASVMIDSIAEWVRKARRKVAGTKGADGVALEAFVERLLTCEGIVGDPARWQDPRK